ncbi:hypothetical protein HUG10_20470 (plasmid) [Halorarum halophilum]|uniref:Concanavalin A-like lectin/glucanases superfamily protein n=1 Tax=Halorarum halophilum TaxID=2743090 RepID=A0A7D5GPR2_9EURY|nr:hypothetical protein [Halobaculum halophilum]QLG29984.1 hypothetical protein HUG10_20470 [Halobaculum halophilum]
MEHGGQTYDVPVFDPADLPPGYRFFRTGAAGGTVGVLPVKPVATDPAYPFIRGYHSGTTYGLHDSAPTVIEDFESGLTNWNGDTQDATTVSSPSVSGSALAMINSNFNEVWNTTITVQQGDVIIAHIRGASASFQFGVVQTGSGDREGYALRHNQEDQIGPNTTLLYRMDEDIVDPTLATFDSSVLNANEFFTYVIAWGTDDTIRVNAYDSAGTFAGGLNATDPTHTSGGIGFRRGASDMDVYLDEVMTL